MILGDLSQVFITQIESGGVLMNVMARAFANKILKTHLIWSLETTETTGVLLRETQILTQILRGCAAGNFCPAALAI